MEISKLRWAYGNRCRKLHVLPENKFTPSLCGFVPTGSRGGTVDAQWSVVKEYVVLNIADPTKDSGRHSLCRECLKLSKTS